MPTALVFSTCGGITEGVGNTITVRPTVTTDYYVRAEV